MLSKILSKMGTSSSARKAVDKALADPKAKAMIDKATSKGVPVDAAVRSLRSR